MPILLRILVIIAIIVALLVLIAAYDGLFQKNNAVKAAYPLLGRFRYIFHELRPLMRQYFGDDDSFAPRAIIDRILHVSEGKSGYFWFDKFDTTGRFHDDDHQMIHASTPYNTEEMQPQYPLVWSKRKHPMQFYTYFYRSSMSLGSLGFEATWSMSKACADIQAAYNTGEWWLSVHHIPNVPFSFDKKYFKYKKIPKIAVLIYKLIPSVRLKNRRMEWLWNIIQPEMGDRDLFLLDKTHRVFYTIDWDQPLEVFPTPGELGPEFGQLIFQIGSGLYGLRKEWEDGTVEIDRERFAKVTSFVRAIEIKLAQGAKQTWWLLKGEKVTHTIATIRGVPTGKDIVSPNRFPYYEPGNHKGFIEFMEEVSQKSGSKPVGCKVVISDRSNVEGIIQTMSQLPAHKWPDFITVDGWDGWSGAAPVALGILFGKKIYDALEILVGVLEEYKVRDRVKIFASSKLYAPHMSARAMALWADAIGNARSIMIAGGCIRAGLCSGEYGVCPVGMATMKNNKRRGYQQVMETKAKNIANYIKAHNKGLIQVAAVAGVKSPTQLTTDHIVIKRYQNMEQALAGHEAEKTRK